MPLELDYYSLSLFIGGVVALISGASVFFFGSKQKIGLPWMLLNITTAVWSFGYFSMLTATDLRVARLSDWILHWGALFIPVFYFYFIIVLTDTFQKYRYFFYAAFAVALGFAFAVPSDQFVTTLANKYTFAFAPEAGKLYIYFTIFFFLTVLTSIGILSRKIISAVNADSPRLKYVLFSSVGGLLGGGSVFLFTFDINIPPYPIILFTFYPLVITYAILRHNLFETKIITAELLVFGLWTLFLFRTLLSADLGEQILNLVFLVVTVVLGIFLILSVIKEVRLREELENITAELEKTNARLTELDQLKSQFLSLASHQLRSPLAAIKGYASLILENSFGEPPAAIREAVDKIFQSSKSLVSIVQDFLDVSRIEQGRMKYDFAEADMKELIKNVADELMPTIKQRGLQIKFSDDGNSSYTIKADFGKVKQVVGNLIDNAIKYTPKGVIEVKLSKDKEKGELHIAIKDSGVGIPPDTLSKLFQKFSRDKAANEVNVMGTGLGLYVARELIHGHHGEVWAESEGVGKGSTFHITLPLDQHVEHVEAVTELAKAM